MPSIVEFGPVLHSRRKTVVFHLSPERDGADLQRLGGFTTVTTEAFECTLDHDLLLLLEIEGVITGTASRLLSDFRWEITNANVGIVGKDDRAFHGVLQLPDVTRPSVVHQSRHRIRRHGADVLFHPGRCLDEEVMHERRDVLASISQRGDGDDERTEAEIEIFAKGSGLNGRAQVAVRRSDDASVHLDAALRTDPANFTLLQRPEQLRLDCWCNLADLVQEDGAGARDFEETRLVPDGSGE